MIKKEKELNARWSEPKLRFPFGYEQLYILCFMFAFSAKWMEVSDPNDCDRNLVLWVFDTHVVTAMSV